MTTKNREPQPYYDRVSDRWKIECHCGRIVARAKREAAEHAMAQHRAYEHGEG